MAKIEYQSAYNEQGEKVDANSVLKSERNQKFTCINCKCLMYPAMGEKQRWHFRHLNTNPNCLPESYLHELAKIRMKEVFDKRDRFLIEAEVMNMCDKFETCLLRKRNTQKTLLNEEGIIGEIECNRFHKKIIDLKERYDTCELEKTYGEFRPDVCFFNSKNPDIKPLFGEIFVTHLSEKKKLNSGYPIIEIKIRDEVDVELFSAPVLREIKQVSVEGKKKKEDLIVFHNVSDMDSVLPYQNNPQKCGVSFESYYRTVDGRHGSRKIETICHNLYDRSTYEPNVLAEMVLTNRDIINEKERKYIRRCWFVANRLNEPYCEQCIHGKRIINEIPWIQSEQFVCSINPNNVNDLFRQDYRNVTKCKCEFFEYDQTKVESVVDQGGCIGWVNND